MAFRISYILILLTLFSCQEKRVDDYKEMAQNIQINPMFEQMPPIASRLFVEELEDIDKYGNNLRLKAEFDDGVIEGQFLALMLNDEKIVLRDDGKGADEKEGDQIFSILIKDNIDSIKSEIELMSRQIRSNEALPIFKNRTMQLISSDIIKEFNIQEFRKGSIFRIPPELLRPVRLLSDQSKTLMITNTEVVEDTTRTFNPCTKIGNPSGIWTFGELMRQLASPNSSSIANDTQVSNFVRSWLLTWASNQTVNGESLPSRNIQNLIIDWETKSGQPPGGLLKMEFAPFKLIAIVNRMDLRGNSGYGFSDAGEGRFVFNALGEDCSPLPFTVIFEYGINKRSCIAVKSFAQEWNSLNSLTLGSTAYNLALENITKQFTQCGTNPAKPNESSLNQLRTNERAISSPWELREFNLNTSGLLDLVDVKQEPAVKFNGDNSATVSPDTDVNEMANWVNSNSTAIVNNNYEVPLNLSGTIPFRGGHSLFVNDNVSQIWDGRGTSGATTFITNDQARHIFSLNTCSACHGGETKTFFTQINPTPFGFEATLSGFLTGLGSDDIPDGVAPHFDNDASMNGSFFVADPASRPIPGGAQARGFNDLLRRRIDLADLISNTCSRHPFFDLAHILTFNPIRMTH